MAMTLTNLAKALKKVGDYCTFDDLPSDRIDNLWDKLAVDCNLTFSELSALKNHRCSGHSQGIQGIVVCLSLLLPNDFFGSISTFPPKLIDL